MLVEAVETRFGQASVGAAKLEFLSDNGGLTAPKKRMPWRAKWDRADSHAGVQPVVERHRRKLCEHV